MLSIPPQKGGQKNGLKKKRKNNFERLIHLKKHKNAFQCLHKKDGKKTV